MNGNMKKNIRRKIKQANKCQVCGKIIRDWNKSGLCSYHHTIAYQKEHREEKRLYEKEYHSRPKIKAKMKAYGKKYREENQLELNKKQRAYYYKNKDKINEIQKRDYQKKRESILKRHSERYKARKESHLCVRCGKKVEPILTYPIHCVKHRKKQKPQNNEVVTTL